PRPVKVAEVRLAPATETRAFTGVVRARREADIAFRTGGRITARLVEVGQKVTAGQPLARLDEADLALGMRAAESELASAAAQAPFWARPAEPHAARLRELAPQAEVALRTYTARFSLPAAPDWVALGMTGTVRTMTRAASIATLPLSALHDRGQGPMVWKVE